MLIKRESRPKGKVDQKGKSTGMIVFEGTKFIAFDRILDLGQGKTDIDEIIEIAGERLFVQVKNSNGAWRRRSLGSNSYTA